MKLFLINFYSQQYIVSKNNTIKIYYKNNYRLFK